MLRWLHIVISNVKAFIKGTYHGLPVKYLDIYLDAFCIRFSRRSFGADLFQRLSLDVRLIIVSTYHSIYVVLTA